MLFSQHGGSLFGWPGLGETLRTVGDPVRGHGHDRRILRQYFWLYRFKSIRRRVMGISIFGGILIHVYAGQSRDDKRAGVSAKLHLVAYFNRPPS